ncbi:hypothetical protein Nstercoris_01159 [Nitrosomonas stercoris]|uniref:Uncharacterized protein n=1 Tax=Nitrosomonas stercoris TaxID=1444684 RepID=A0A4Y1YM70_9PROT|nr:hypothetical protein Nstercoris_01159 [Nitrosomonas stercoris]
MLFYSGEGDYVTLVRIGRYISEKEEGAFGRMIAESAKATECFSYLTKQESNDVYY